MISVECVNCGAQNTTFLDDPNATSAVITCHSCGAVLPNPDRQATGSSPPPADDSAEPAHTAPKLDTPWVVSEQDIVAAPTGVVEAETVDSQWSSSAVWPPPVPEEAPSVPADVAPSASVTEDAPAFKNAVVVPVHAREEAPWIVSEQDIVSPLVTDTTAEKPAIVSQAPRVSMVVDPDGWDAPQAELAAEPPPSVEPMVLSKPTPIANPLAAALKIPESELPRTTLRLDAAPPPPPPPPVVTRSYGEPPPPPPPPPPPIVRAEAPDSELVATDRDAPLLDEFESSPRLQATPALPEALAAPESPPEEVLPEALSQFPQDEQAAAVVTAPYEAPNIERPNAEARPAEALIPTAPSLQLPAVPLAAVPKAAPAVNWAVPPVVSAEDARMPTDAPVARSASFVDLGHAAYSSPQRKWLQGALAAAAVAAAFVVGRATTTSTPAKPTQAEIQAAAAELVKERDAARPSPPPLPAAAPVKEAAAAAPAAEPTKPITPDADAATVVTRTGKHNAATLAAAVEAANKAGFDPNAAGRALGEAAARASSCKRPGDNATQATVFVTFGPSGRVAGANVSGLAFSSSAMRNCIGQVLKDVRVPAFSGTAAVTVKKVVRI